MFHNIRRPNAVFLSLKIFNGLNQTPFFFVVAESAPIRCVITNHYGERKNCSSTHILPLKSHGRGLFNQKTDLFLGSSHAAQIICITIKKQPQPLHTTFAEAKSMTEAIIFPNTKTQKRCLTPPFTSPETIPDEF